MPPDNATGNFTKIVQRVPVRIALPADGPLAPLLRPGLSVTVTVDTARAGRRGRRRRRRRRGAGRHAQPRAMSWTLTLPLRRAAARAPSGRGPRAARRAAAAPPAPPAAGAGGPPPQPTLRDWFGVLAMVFGLFMAIMDVQIVTSSLTQIQGGLSASADEIAWVQTAYLIADVVMVPLSGMLSRLLSTRVLFVAAALGFTGASALCATATSLGQMILYRAMQGFCGGAMTPTVFPVVYTRFRGAAAGDGHGADLADPQPVLDLGPDDRRLPDRHLFLALAVPGQHRARHRSSPRWCG